MNHAARLDHLLASVGGLASTRRLAEAGISPHHLRVAIVEGRAERVRQGWVAGPTAPPDAVRAVRVGGWLTCVSALRMRGVWCSDDGRLHVRVDRHTNHLASPDDRARPLAADLDSSVVIHRSYATGASDDRPPVDSVESALMHAATCQSRDNAVVLFDSALNLKLTSSSRLRNLVSGLTARHREVFRLCDASAQSGLESKARLRLHALGIPYRTQVYFEGVGKVDLVGGDRLVLELDGKEWHSTEAAFAEDRRRDLIHHERGRLVIRLTYAQVMFEWTRIEALLRGLVARREHRWSARHRRAGFAPATAQSAARPESSVPSAADQGRAADSVLGGQLGHRR